jgi:type II secretory pathway pseudopilin PulG
MPRQLKGVTLVELVMVMVITALVMLSFSGYIKQAVDTWNYLSYRSDILNDARLELMRMGRNIRSLSAIDSANGVNSTTFSFFSNASGSPYMRYTYNNSANTVFYTDNSGSYPFMNNVNIANGNFFDYFYASPMISVNMSDANTSNNISNNGLIVRIKPRFNDRGQALSIDYDVSPRKY